MGLGSSGPEEQKDAEARAVLTPPTPRLSTVSVDPTSSIVGLSLIAAVCVCPAVGGLKPGEPQGRQQRGLRRDA